MTSDITTSDPTNGIKSTARWGQHKLVPLTSDRRYRHLESAKQGHAFSESSSSVLAVAAAGSAKASFASHATTSRRLLFIQVAPKLFPPFFFTTNTSKFAPNSRDIGFRNPNPSSNYGRRLTNPDGGAHSQSVFALTNHIPTPPPRRPRPLLRSAPLRYPFPLRSRRGGSFREGLH